jgi:membrane-bound lytic murein transglycosylase B
MGRMQRRRRGNRIVPGLVAALVFIAVGAWAAVQFGGAQLPLLTGRIPAVAFDAYRAASSAAPTITSSCAVDWSIVAAIAQVESRHGRIDDRALTASGDVVPPIRGRALDGSGGTQTIPDTDGGQLDGDVTWDRAMGPLQFIPTTWRELGRDGNADGVSDPDNLYDASLTAVAHLCIREPGDYSQRAELRRALIGYNASGRYADDVLDWVERYRTTPIEEIVEDPADPA